MVAGELHSFPLGAGGSDIRDGGLAAAGTTGTRSAEDPPPKLLRGEASGAGGGGGAGGLRGEDDSGRSRGLGGSSSGTLTATTLSAISRGTTDDEGRELAGSFGMTKD